jgi:hypothetical protein
MTQKEQTRDRTYSSKNVQLPFCSGSGWKHDSILRGKLEIAFPPKNMSHQASEAACRKPYLVLGDDYEDLGKGMDMWVLRILKAFRALAFKESDYGLILPDTPARARDAYQDIRRRMDYWHAENRELVQQRVGTTPFNERDLLANADLGAALILFHMVLDIHRKRPRTVRSSDNAFPALLTVDLELTCSERMETCIKYIEEVPAVADKVLDGSTWVRDFAANPDEVGQGRVVAVQEGRETKQAERYTVRNFRPGLDDSTSNSGAEEDGTMHDTGEEVGKSARE